MQQRIERVWLVDANPHPEHGYCPAAIESWFGAQIEIGEPITPSQPMPCGTATLWKILGPPHFLALLAHYGRRDRYICIHMIDTAIEGVPRDIQAGQSPLEHRHG